MKNDSFIQFLRNGIAAAGGPLRFFMTLAVIGPILIGTPFVITLLLVGLGFGEQP